MADAELCFEYMPRWAELAPLLLSQDPLARDDAIRQLEDKERALENFLKEKVCNATPPTPGGSGNTILETRIWGAGASSGLGWTDIALIASGDSLESHDTLITPSGGDFYASGAVTGSIGIALNDAITYTGSIRVDLEFSSGTWFWPPYVVNVEAAVSTGSDYLDLITVPVHAVLDLPLGAQDDPIYVNWRVVNNTNGELAIGDQAANGYATMHSIWQLGSPGGG